MSNIILHTGGWDATEDDIRAANVPQGTKSYVAVPHSRLIEEVRFNLPRFGIQETRSRWALAKNGDRMFGVMNLDFPGIRRTNGHGLTLGLRNSYDKSMSVGLVAGTNVFVCDNLAFHGEIEMRRNHTRNIFRDLPGMLYEMLERLGGYFQRNEAFVRNLQEAQLSQRDADHLLVESVRRDILPVTKLPKVMHEYEEPTFEEFKDRNAWSLFNAYTYVAKKTNPGAQIDDTVRLTRLFAEEFGGLKEAEVLEVS